MKDYQERVIVEQDALVKNLEALNRFIGGTVFKDLDIREQERMKRQGVAMAQYSDVLAERIVAF
ncbi:hypothetical protein LCGC14_1049800 [marine sediment metagenome]|uniref:Uncharacterized protein n=1 Tax=marine sediment metagenome TaxID=412755 RepID=A0A0F9Q791_9ZZZZ